MIKSISNLIIAKSTETLYSAGLNTVVLLNKSGISAYELETPGVRLSEEQYYAFLEHSAKYLGHWNAKTIEFITHQNSMDLSYALFPKLTNLCLNEKTAYESLLGYINNRVIIGNIEDIIVSVKPDETKIDVVDHSPNKINTIPLIGVIIHLYSLVKMYHPSVTIKVGLATNQYRDMLSHFFHGNCIFNQDNSYLIFDSKQLFSENRQFNPFLYKYQKVEVEQETSALLYKNSFIDTVTVLIEKAMRIRDEYTENSILNNVCDNLRISRWTLNQRLKGENTNFTLLLKKVRIKKACALLSVTNSSMQEISDQLMFSSQSVFSRFFSMNTGESPASFRKKYSSQK